MMASTPKASRPHMPDYGLHDAQGGKGLIAWGWASERLQSARNYWIATVHPKRKPNMTPVWGVWVKEIFYFTAGPRSRKARNLNANPNCVVSTENATEAVILEGRAARVTDPAILRSVSENYSEKYEWPLHVEADFVYDEHGNGGPVFAVHPQVIFAFREDLQSSATRWVFEGD